MSRLRRKHCHFDGTATTYTVTLHCSVVALMFGRFRIACMERLSNGWLCVCHCKLLVPDTFHASNHQIVCQGDVAPPGSKHDAVVYNVLERTLLNLTIHVAESSTAYRSNLRAYRSNLREHRAELGNSHAQRCRPVSTRKIHQTVGT